METTLARLSESYFRRSCAADPFTATIFGVPGYDAEVPDPSRSADAALRAGYAALADDLAALDPAGLGEEDRVTHRMLAHQLADRQETLRHGMEEFVVTATGMGAVSAVFAVVPTAAVADPAAAEAYLSRLRGLGGYFDAIGARHRQAAADGRLPVARGVRQAISQLDGYLASPVESDPFLRPEPAAPVDAAAWRARAAELVTAAVRPGLARYRDLLAEHLLPAGRPDDRVGACHVPGGGEGYRALVASHTTTSLTPEEIHETGRRLVAQLQEEFAVRGSRALGTAEVPEVLRRLREDPSLRFTSAEQIVATVEDALRRAEAALPDWFPVYDIAACTVTEMDPVEAENSTLAYYLPPAADGSRPGRHVVNTHRPDLRPRYEYETLAFHESVPGHHLQFAVAQTLTGLPDFRRFGHVTAYGEGWGLYTERLCDEMGLYSGELSRLGMVSFDAWRACRLVVDTGIHHFGWSRDRAIRFMREHTALSETNIANEVDRYVAAPGQALAYMIGRLRIGELRERSAAAGLDVREFHHRVLRHGSVPLDLLTELVGAA